MEAILLAGGTGTDLKFMKESVPKHMAPVNHQPFMKHTFYYLMHMGISHVVIAAGEQLDAIKNFFGDSYNGIDISYSIEEVPLGTGGAIKKAFELCRQDHVFVMNADVYYDVDLDMMNSFHVTRKSRVTLALKPMQEYRRYKTILVEDEKVEGVVGPKYMDEGYISGGVYLINRSVFDQIPDEVFSFEEDILEKLNMDIYAFISDGYFVDLDVRKDYYQSQIDFMDLYMT